MKDYNLRSKGEWASLYSTLHLDGRMQLVCCDSHCSCIRNQSDIWVSVSKPKETTLQREIGEECN